MTRLSVNLNKIALLRNSRTLGIPSVTRAAAIVLDAGAHGITVHPRPDARHIRISDVHELAALLKGRAEAEFNIEGNPFQGLLEVVRAVHPQQCTLVPDDPGAFTSDHGWDIKRDGERLKPVITELKALGIRVSLFMDPLPEAMPAVHALGANRVELYTEPYAKAYGADEIGAVEPYAAAAHAAQRVGLGVNAGHDLNQQNLPRFLSAVPNVLEVSIGHALVADALEAGLAQTVRNYLAAITLGGDAPERPAMIYGIGIDIVEPHRVQRLLEKYGERFARRVLTEREWPGYVRTINPVLFVANRFAAKEAFSKAMGTGFRYPVTLQCISIVQDRRGKPGFEFHPKLAQLVTTEGIVGHHVTISDEKSLACACVVLERQ